MHLHDFQSFLNEKIVYPDGDKSAGDKILDKVAKLLNSSKSTVEITRNQVRGIGVDFGFSGPTTFSVAKRDGFYLMNTSNGFFRVEEKDVKSAEDLYDEVESIVQGGKTKRSRETDMFGK
jgi:hypothetical protein